MTGDFLLQQFIACVKSHVVDGAQSARSTQGLLRAYFALIVRVHRRPNAPVYEMAMIASSRSTCNASGTTQLKD
jgi:hypothetical protein